VIVIMQKNATKQAIAATERQIRDMGYETRVVGCSERTVIRVLGGECATPCRGRLESLPAVERVIPVLETPGRIRQGSDGERSLVTVGERVVFGGRQIPVMVAIGGAESEDDLCRTVETLRASGAAALWIGDCPEHDESFRTLVDAATRSGLLICLEIEGPELVEWQAERADMLCVSAGNMRNFDLLQTVGRQKKPVLLRRRATATTGEWRVSAEYVMTQGNTNVMLCETGRRPFGAAAHHAVDFRSVAALRQETDRPVVVAPCHAAQHAGVVEPAALAAIASGADGVMVEVRFDRRRSLPGCIPVLTPTHFSVLMESMRRVAEAVGREL